jgi:FtsP/CotA-like multicopper oxidase with cupredoxin domain
MEYQTVTLGNKPVKAITVNGQIPAPELRFTEGDEVIINLHNTLDEPGSIHWHGLLVPYKMDGVPWVSMPPIAPGDTFQYRFTLKQSVLIGITHTANYMNSRGYTGPSLSNQKLNP